RAGRGPSAAGVAGDVVQLDGPDDRAEPNLLRGDVDAELALDVAGALLRPPESGMHVEATTEAAVAGPVVDVLAAVHDRPRPRPVNHERFHSRSGRPSPRAVSRPI